MSYDIELMYEDQIAIVPEHREGGTYALNGKREAALNVTYNYGPFFYEHIDAELGIRWLYGKLACETVERLRAAVAALGTERHDDYWAPTPGNAGYALSILLMWAGLHPRAMWQGD